MRFTGVSLSRNLFAYAETVGAADACGTHAVTLVLLNGRPVWYHTRTFRSTVNANKSEILYTLHSDTMHERNTTLSKPVATAHNLTMQ